MEGLIIFGVIVAVVLFTSLFKNIEMSSKVKNTIAVVLSTIGGIVADLTSRGFDVSTYQGVDILTAALVIYGGSQLIYKFILEGTRVDAKIEDASLIPVGRNDNEGL